MERIIACEWTFITVEVIKGVVIRRSAQFSVKIHRSSHFLPKFRVRHFVIKMMAQISIVRHFYPSRWKEEEDGSSNSCAKP